MLSKVLIVLACLTTLALAQYEAISSSSSPIGYVVPSPSKSPSGNGYALPSASNPPNGEKSGEKSPESSGEKAPESSGEKSPEKSGEKGPEKSNAPNGYYQASATKAKEDKVKESKAKEGKPSKTQTPLGNGYYVPAPSKYKVPECAGGVESFKKGAKESNKKCGGKIKESSKIKEGIKVNEGSYLDIYSDVDVDDELYVDQDSYVGVYGGKVNVKSCTIKGTYDVYANNDYMINSYGPATIDGYVNVILPANYDFKYGARLVFLKFSKLIGKFKGSRVSYVNSDEYTRAVSGVRDMRAMELSGSEVPSVISCTATECAVVSRVNNRAAEDSETEVTAEAPRDTQKLALAIGLGAGLPIVLAMVIAVVVVSRRRNAQNRAAKNDVEANTVEAPSASSLSNASKVSSASSGTGTKSARTSAEQSSASSNNSGTASTA